MISLIRRFRARLRAGVFRALRHRNYRLYFLGQIISFTGTWVTSVATGWLVYRLTDSELLLGVVSFSGHFPAVLLAPVSGVLVDRWNRRTVLLWTQSASMLQSLALAVLTFTGLIEVWSICALAAFQALVNAFDMPARQSLVYELIEDKLDLPNAIALNSAMFNAARLVGPAVGGFIIALSNEATCFLVDALSYVAVLASLWRIRLDPAKLIYARYRVWDGLREGSSYIRETMPIRSVLALVASIYLLGTSYIALMPVFARQILAGGPGLLGVLMSASGAGALIGALLLASRRSVSGIGTVISMCGFALGIALCGFAYSTVVWLSLLLLFCAGVSMIMLVASCNTVIQMLVDASKRGRVMSFYLMASMGMMPLGSLGAGSLASSIGAPHTVALSGVSCLLIAVIFLRQLPQLRQQARELRDAQLAVQASATA